MDTRNKEHYWDPTPAEALRQIEKRARNNRARKEVNKVHNKIFAIDPGTTMSGYVIFQHDGQEVTHVLEKGKIANEELLRRLPYELGRCEIVVEMVASYGMPVGREVFETCVWIGRFLQAGGVQPSQTGSHLVYRMEEKEALCHSTRANDGTIRQALVDRYAPGQANYGKGTKKTPGFFFGFAADAWQAMAVGVTWLDRERGKLE